MWFVAVTMITASYAGAMASIVDIAPNLAGPVLAFAQTIHMTASFVSPIISGLIVVDKVRLYFPHIQNNPSTFYSYIYICFKLNPLSKY